MPPTAWRIKKRLSRLLRVPISYRMPGQTRRNTSLRSPRGQGPGHQYWIQDEHAQRGENWDIANKSNIPLCKAFICAETPKTRNNKNVLDEIALAMEAHTRHPEYQIFRIQSSNFYNFDDKSDTFTPEDFRKSLLDILKDEALVEYYMNLTVEVIDMENLKNPDVWDTVINNLPK